MSLLPRSLVLFGAGKMGGALLKGWLHGPVSGSAVTILDPAPGEEVLRLAAEHGCTVNPAFGQIGAPQCVVVAIKPQALDDAAPMLETLVGPETLLISVMAGKRVSDLQMRLTRVRKIIRAMPNTPAAIMRGITALYAAPGTTALDREHAERLIACVGAVEWLDAERQIDAVTAVSGSGPAYVFVLTECLARAGEAAGLGPDLAARLARATVEGAGELMFRSPDLAPADLRRNVTSPGGTTAAALAVLNADDALARLMEQAVLAAARRAEGLSG